MSEDKVAAGRGELLIREWREASEYCIWATVLASERSG